MTPDITIANITLQIQRSLEDKLSVTITLKNNSTTSTYYFLKRPRQIDYDKGHHTLSIDLYEKLLPQDIKSGAHLFAPEQLVIPPNTSLNWQYLLPIWMKKITRPPGSREIVEVVNISGVQKVVCTVAYHTSPFHVNPSDNPEDVPVALAKWGKTVSAGFERTPGTLNSEC